MAKSEWIDATSTSTNPKWDFEEKETIQGVMIGKRLDVTDRKMCFYDIEVSGEGTFSILGNVVINRILRDLPIGTEIRITYLGEAKSKTGTNFKNYKVEYNKATMPQKSLVDIAEEEFADIRD